MPASTGAKNPRAQWNGIGTGIVGTIGYVVLPTGVSTDVSRDMGIEPESWLQSHELGF